MEALAAVQNYILEHDLIRRGDTVLLAVSGGIDSVTMADLLARLQDQLDFQPVIATFNHRLRPEAEEETAFVQALAQRYGVPFYQGSADIAALSQGKNLQDTARRERYAFLFSVAYKLGAASVATAHHRDDQAETLLLHLLRGSGTAGLAGMAPARNKVIRPLLALTREDIAAYATARGLEYREDHSNASVKYQRNRIRWELLPILRHFNPRVVEALNATAAICRDEDALLDDLAENALAEVLLRDGRAIDAAGFAQLPTALKRRVLKKAFCLLAGDVAELSFSQVEAILALKEEQSVSLPGGIRAYRRGNICFGTEIPPLPGFSDAYPLIADGAWHALGNWGWEYTASLEETEPHAPPHGLYVAERELPRLSWRTRREGDALPSRGASGRTKLKEIFIDHKIPAYQRNSWPLLLLDQEIVWAPLLKKALSPAPGQSKSILIKVRHCDII